GEEDGVAIALASPHLHNLRVLHLGDVVPDHRFPASATGPLPGHGSRRLYEPGAEAWRRIAALPCLEELDLYVDTASIETLFNAPELTGLRVLQVYFGDKFPLAALANNRALGNLTHLALRPRPLRDRGEGHLLRLAELRALLRSHHLTGLTHLRVQQTDLGD